jgi:5-methylcytosine-specific restriction endonuclease McrA
MEINHKCLVLNADYSPLNIISWKRAIALFLKKEYENNIDVEFIEFYSRPISMTNKTIKLPAVIKTNKYYNIHQQFVKFSRKNLFLRDNYTCQYCGIRKEISELTYDHIIPKSQWNYSSGNPTHWLNITTACTKCNRKKANKNPQQAQMPLMNNPTIPRKTAKYLPNISHGHSIVIPNEWLVYI